MISSPPFPDPGYTAEGKTEVLLRFSKHESFNRIVFEASDESFIKSTVVTSLQNQIKIQFPSDINLRPQGKVEVDALLKEKTYMINMNDPFRIKILKLSAPPRLSIDILISKKEERVKSAAVEGANVPVIPNIRITLDAGHGGYDLGILSGELREKDVTLSVALAMESFLIKRNRAVFLTRKADRFLSITDRALFANQKSPDVFVSIHFSLSDNFTIYTSAAESPGSDPVNELYGVMSRQRRYGEKSNALAEGMGKAIKEDFKKEVVYRKMDLPLLASVGAASVMVEIPRNIVSDHTIRTKLSETLLRGIAFYANQ